MSQSVTIEARLSVLEREVADIKQRMRNQPAVDWLCEISGSLKDHPDFDEFVRACREFRESQTDPI